MSDRNESSLGLIQGIEFAFKMEQNESNLEISQGIEFIFKIELPSWIEPGDKPVYFGLPIQIIDNSIRSTKLEVLFF